MKPLPFFVLFLLMTGIVNIASAQKTTVSQEYIRQQISKGRQYCLAFLKRGPKQSTDTLAIKRDQDKHLEYLFSLKKQGKLPIFGPLFEESNLRGVCIFNIADKDSVKKLLDADPHIKSGRLSYEIYRWFGIPGDSLP